MQSLTEDELVKCKDFELNNQGALEAAHQLHSRDFKDRVFEISGCAPGRVEGLSVDFIDEYLKISNPDGGLTEEDIKGLTTYYKKDVSKKGHSEHGVGCKTNLRKIALDYLKNSNERNSSLEPTQITSQNLIQKDTHGVKYTMYHVLSKSHGVTFTIDEKDNSKYFRKPVDFYTNLYNKYSNKNFEKEQTIFIVPCIPDYFPEESIYENTKIIKHLEKHFKLRWNDPIFNGVKIFIQGKKLSVSKPLYNKSYSVEHMKGIDTGKSPRRKGKYIKVDNLLIKHSAMFNDNGHLNYISQAERSSIELDKSYMSYEVKFDDKINDSERRNNIKEDYGLDCSEVHGMRVSKNNVLLSSDPIITKNDSLGMGKNDSRTDYVAACVNCPTQENRVIKTSPDKSGRCTIAPTDVRLVIKGLAKLERANAKQSSVNSESLDSEEYSKTKKVNTNPSSDSTNSDIVPSSGSSKSWSSSSDTKSGSSSDLEEADESFLGSGDADSEPEKDSSDFSKRVKREALVNQKHMCKNITTGECGIEKSIVTKYAPEYRCNYSDVKFAIIGGADLCEYDHKIPKCDRGNSSLENCQALCPCCHAVKTKIEGFLREKK